MNKVDRMSTVVSNVASILNYEQGYAQVLYPVNFAMESKLKSSNDQLFCMIVENNKLNIFKAISAIQSCTTEELKHLQYCMHNK